MKHVRILLPTDFLLDSELVPLRRKSDRSIKNPVPFFVFYVNRGRVFGSDGSIHVPLNPAILVYFSALFEPFLKKSRGSLTFFLNPQDNERYGVVTDNVHLTASLKNYKTALTFASKNNLKKFRDDPQ